MTRYAKKLLLGRTLGICLLSTAWMSHADTYRWVDDQGIVNYAAIAPRDLPPEQIRQINLQRTPGLGDQNGAETQTHGNRPQLTRNKRRARGAQSRASRDHARPTKGRSSPFGADGKNSHATTASGHAACLPTSPPAREIECARPTAVSKRSPKPIAKTASFKHKPRSPITAQTRPSSGPNCSA